MNEWIIENLRDKILIGFCRIFVREAWSEREILLIMKSEFKSLCVMHVIGERSHRCEAWINLLSFFLIFSNPRLVYPQPHLKP